MTEENNLISNQAASRTTQTGSFGINGQGFSRQSIVEFEIRDEYLNLF